MLFLSLEQLFTHLKDSDAQIELSDEVIPYWKRSYEYRSDHRKLDMQEINYVIQGKIFGEINDIPVELGAGDLFWMKAQTPHSLTWQKDLIYYSFRFSIIHKGEHLNIDQPFLKFKANDTLEQICQNIVYTMDASKDQTKLKYIDEQLRAYFLLLMIDLLNMKDNSVGENSKREFDDVQKKLIYSYCISREFRQISSDDLAKVLYYSTDYFTRLFKNTYHTSPREWLFREKINFAGKQLLDTSISLEDMATQLRYSDIYLFSRQFKKVLGLSPKQYIRKNRAIQQEFTPFQKIK